MTHRRGKESMTVQSQRAARVHATWAEFIQSCESASDSGVDIELSVAAQCIKWHEIERLTTEAGK